MAVASHHHGLLDACVSNAFNDILKCHSGSGSADDALQVGRDIEAAVQAAVRRCYNTWNDAHRDPVLRLPKELVLDCFAALDFKGRIAVTHVSRAWRSLALSDFRLWNSLSLQQKRPAVALDTLAAFLERSDPKPFALSWMDLEGTISRSVFDLILRNVHRMESLEIDYLLEDALELLFSTPAPILKTFIYCGLLNLSTLWAGDIAPCLENLDVRQFSISPAFRPITSLRNFGGNLRLHAPPPELLFKIYPGVASMDLRAVTQAAINDFGPLAPSVTGLSLHAAHIERTKGVDYAPIIPNLSRLDLSTLFLSSATAVSGFVQLFVEKTHGERRLEIPWRGDVQMDSDSDNVHFTINTSYLTVSLEKEPGLLAPLRAFSDLSLTLELLVELRGALPEDERTLPNLRALTIILDWMDELQYLPAIHERSRGIGGPIDAPRLDSLSFTACFVGCHPGAHRDARLEAFGAWLSSELPDVLPLVVSYPKEIISSVTLQAEDTASLVRCGADNLWCLESGLESQLKILNMRTREVTTLPLDQDAGK